MYFIKKYFIFYFILSIPYVRLKLVSATSYKTSCKNCFRFLKYEIRYNIKVCTEDRFVYEGQKFHITNGELKFKFSLSNVTGLRLAT